MKKPAIAIVITALLGIGVISVYQPPTDCVSIYIDYGSLDSGSPIEKCITTSGEATALTLLNIARITTEGTQKYGNAVVCRVNGLPDATVESCSEMPPAEAYWAVFIKEYEPFPIPFNTAGEWGWAQTGFNEVHLHNGESLGLVFIENGEVRYP
jgi:hypothetical protein